MKDTCILTFNMHYTRLESAVPFSYKAEYSHIICYIMCKPVLVLLAVCCYGISSKHVLCKLQSDDQRSHQMSTSNYALLALVNSIMNYEIFSSHATTARWERIVHIDWGLRQCYIMDFQLCSWKCKLICRYGCVN